VDELERSLREAKTAGTNVRALCVINPGNPTGQCLSQENMSQVKIDILLYEQILIYFIFFFESEHR
jgi:aspartate/methionine/tyrosine aminotransferase